MIYPLDSAIQRLNNWGQKYSAQILKEAIGWSIGTRVDYVDFVVYPLPQCLEAKLQRVQKSAPSFGNNGRYAKMADIIQCIRMAPCKGKKRNAFIKDNP